MDTHGASQRGIGTAGDNGADRPGWAAQPGSGTAGSPDPPDHASTGLRAPTPPGSPAKQSPPSPQPKGKRQSVLASLIVIVILIALRFGLPALFGEATEPGGLVNRTIYSEDFSGGPGKWGTMSSGTATAEVSGGTYNIHLRQRNDELNPFIYLPEGRWESVAVEASARPVGQARTAFGIGCLMSTDEQQSQSAISGTVYMIVIVPSVKGYAITHQEDMGDRAVLEAGKIPEQVVSGSGPFQLRATCSTTDGTATDLSFFVDSHQIATMTDPNGPGAFNGMGIGAATTDPNGEVRFDDTVVKRI